MKKNVAKNEIMHGLSILRIISMFAIIGLHVINAGGGVFDRSTLLSISTLPVAIFYILCVSSVDTFAMLTGYLYADKQKVKYKNIIKLIFNVILYSALITIIFFIVKPSVFTSIWDIIKSLFPPLAGSFWYITCYVLMFVLIPYLNKLINNISLREFKVLLILLIFLTSVVPTFLITDFFKMDWGYSAAWLMVCYLIGAYIKRSKSDMSTKNILLTYLLCVIAVMLMTVAGKILFNSLSVYAFLTLYTSPIIVIISAISIILFSKITLKEGKLTKIINSLSNSSFDAYIIHCHFLVFNYFIVNKFMFVESIHPLLRVPTVIGSIIAIYLICWVIAQIKSFIFKVTKTNVMFDKVGNKIDSLLKL